MEYITFTAPKTLVEQIEEEALKIGMDSRSNFLRVVVTASIKQIKKEGFEIFISNSAKRN